MTGRFIAQTPFPVSPIRYYDEVVGFGASIYASRDLFSGAPVFVDLSHVEEMDWIYDEEFPLLLQGSMTHWAWNEDLNRLTVKNDGVWEIVIGGLEFCPFRKKSA